MINKILIIAGVLIVPLVSACVPFPTKNVEVPRISGTLDAGREGAEGYEVVLAYGVGDACEVAEKGGSLSAITDSAGQFEFGPTYKWSLIRWAVPVDSIDYLNLCVTTPDGERKWGYITHIRTPAWAPNLELKCSYNSLLNSPMDASKVSIYELKNTCSEIKS